MKKEIKKINKKYKRKTYTIEDVLTDVINQIGYEGIEKAIGKKRSSIQHMSNPLYAERQLDHKDSIKLDVYLRNNGFGNPFLDAHKTLIENLSSSAQEKETTALILKNLVNLGESIGGVMKETHQALEDNKITDQEKEKIAGHLKDLERKIAELKARLHIGEEIDHTLASKREF